MFVPAPEFNDCTRFIVAVVDQIEPFQVSVVPTTEGVLPPIAKAAVFDPAPAKPFLAVIKSATSVQLVPFQVSVTANSVKGLGSELPPNAKAAVDTPTPDAIPSLPVFKLFTSVQLVPFQSSVSAWLAVPGLSPPKARAAVLSAPVPPNPFLAVFKSLTSVQLVPFQSSVES